MCSLCNCTDKERANFCNDFAVKLRKLAYDYEAIGSSRIKLHTKEGADIGLIAKSVIRELVEWI